MPGVDEGFASRVPVVLCFDVEPDENLSPPGRPSPWRGFERLLGLVDGLRATLSSATDYPARFSWFLRLDPEIAQTYGSHGWVFDRYARSLESLAREGDGLGVHTHMARWDGFGWILDHGDADWVERCLESSVTAFRQEFREAPRFHRFGDNWMSEAALFALGSLGVRCDISALPGCRAGPPPGAVFTGEYPDTSAIPRVPYRPADGGRDGPWELPLSCTDEESPPRRVARLSRRARHPIRTLVNGATRVVRHRDPSRLVLTPRWHPIDPIFDWRTGADFWGVAQRHLARLDRPYLAFAVRSDVAVRRRQLGNFQRVFNHLAETPLARQLAFTTPDEALRRLLELEKRDGGTVS